MIEFTHLFIGGRRVAPLGSDVIEVRSPDDGARVGSVPAASLADMDLAVAEARRAFDHGPWPRMAPAERQAVLSRFAALHAARADEFAAFISRENGSPLWFTHAVQQGVVPQNAAYLKAAAEFSWKRASPPFRWARACGGASRSAWWRR